MEARTGDADELNAVQPPTHVAQSKALVRPESRSPEDNRQHKKVAGEMKLMPIVN